MIDKLRYITMFAGKVLGWAFDVMAILYWCASTFIQQWVSLPETDSWVNNLIGIGVFLLICARAYYVAFKKK